MGGFVDFQAFCPNTAAEAGREQAGARGPRAGGRKNHAPHTKAAHMVETCPQTGMSTAVPRTGARRRKPCSLQPARPRLDSLRLTKLQAVRKHSSIQEDPLWWGQSEGTWGQARRGSCECEWGQGKDSVPHCFPVQEGLGQGSPT